MAIVVKEGTTVADLRNRGINDASSLRLPDSLRALSLSNNQINNLERLRLPAGLQRLFLGGNQINNLEHLHLPDSLQWLDLSGNQINNLEHLRLPDGLRELWINRNPIEHCSDIYINPKTHIYPDPGVEQMIREAVRETCAKRIQRVYRKHLLQRIRAARVIQRYWEAKLFNTCPDHPRFIELFT